MRTKLLLSASALFSRVAPLTANSIENNERKSFNEHANFQINEIENDLKKNSKIIGSEFIYNYQGEQFRDKNSILNKEFLKNPILQENTSSNPNKIIKNYSTNELDSEKVFGNNSNDFVKVYKNALGKTVLPNCLPGENSGYYRDPNNENTKSAQDRALDSYMNKGLMRPKYSYDSVDWFDSEFEAKNAYQKNNFSIKQSLFYFYNGLYYNAFNKNDMKDLQAKMQKGYYYDAFKTKYDKNGFVYEVENGPLFGKMNSNPLENSFRFKKDYFDDYFKENFREYFIQNTDEIIKSAFSYSITLTAPNGQWFEIKKNNYPGINLKVLESGKKLLISVTNDGREFIKLKKFISSLNTRGEWTGHLVNDYCNSFENNRRRWHEFEYADSLNKENNLVFALETYNDGCPQSGFNDTNPENIKIDDQSVKSSNFNINILDNTFINHLNNYFNIKNSISYDFSGDKLFEDFSKNIGLDSMEILKEISNITKLGQLNNSYKNILFEIIMRNLKKICIIWKY